jgi:serine/threonine-protein kinase
MPIFEVDCDLARLEQALRDHRQVAADPALAGHIERCEACRARLEQLAAEPGWWSRARLLLQESDESAEPPDETPWLGYLRPTDFPHSLGRLGSYEVTGVIGSGGFGTVLKALDPALNRYVAIKALLPHLATSAAARRRFAREARAAAAVVNDHVIAIHAVQEANGIPYLVMPYVPGRSLQERIEQQGALELQQVVRIAMQTALGLAAAHAQGLVHRDVKPGNILLETDLERVRITDFGLARTIDEASQTHSGLLAGTPQYMSPEQARGEPVDHRSDLFSLGSVIYCMCTGHSPFRAASTVAVLQRICHERPRPLCDANPEMPLWVSRLVERLMQRDPGRRFSSAAEVAALLEGYLAHLRQPRVKRAPRLPAAAWGRLRLPRSQSRAARGAAALAALAALVLSAWPDAPRPARRGLARTAGAPSLQVQVLGEPGLEQHFEQGLRAALLLLERLEWSSRSWQPDRQPLSSEILLLDRSIDRLERALAVPVVSSPASQSQESQ